MDQAQESTVAMPAHGDVGVTHGRADHGRRHSLGPLTFRTDHADVRYVCWAGVEIIRRIFVTVRDAEWREVPPAQWSSSLSSDATRLQFRLAAHYDEDHVGFEWRGVFSADTTNRELSFSISGTATCDMRVNRLGLVVLHPAEQLVSGSIKVAGPLGQESVDLAEHVYPQRVVDGLPTGMTVPFRTLTTSFAGGESARFIFSGELFEIEDQRNFGDSSLKSYCPPLSSGFPRPVQSGQEISHAMTCEVRVVEGKRPVIHTDPIDIQQLRFHRPARMPSLGVQAQLTDPAVTSQWASAYFEHIQVDASADASADDLDHLCRGISPHVGLEVRLCTTTAGDVDSDLLDTVCAAQNLKRILLVEEGRPLARGEVSERLASNLRSRGCIAPIYVAVNDYFVELNRGVPVPASQAGVAIPICPTIHSGDVLTVSENVGAIPDMVRTAATILATGRDVSVGQLTLAQGPQPDPEVYDVVALPWFVASFLTLCQTPVSSVTVGSDVVPSGEIKGQTSAVWSALLDLLMFARSTSVDGIASRPDRRFYAVGWRRPSGGRDLLLVNLGDEAQHVVCGRDAAIRSSSVLWPQPGDEPSHPSGAMVVPGFGVSHVEMGR